MQKSVYLVDLVKSVHTSISYLFAKSASTPPSLSLPKFGADSTHLLIRPPREVRGGEPDAEGNPTRMLPHAGAVDVMLQDKEAEACVSCGDDGWILCFF